MDTTNQRSDLQISIATSSHRSQFEQETEPLPQVFQTNENKFNLCKLPWSLMLIACGVLLIVFALTFHFVGNELSDQNNHENEHNQIENVHLPPIHPHEDNLKSLSPEFAAGGPSDNPQYRSLAPSANPHVALTSFPSDDPSNSPDTLQRQNPSGSPLTDHISGSPTLKTDEPTLQTDGPTLQTESAVPSNRPLTSLPSNNPSGNPQSAAPSNNPSDSPSESPETDVPSDYPSDSPEISAPSHSPQPPSDIPLHTPSDNPSTGSPQPSTENPTELIINYEKIVSKSNGKCLEMDTDYYDIKQSNCWVPPKNSQKWYYHPATQSIRNVYNNYCLYLDGRVETEPCNGGNNQRWTLSGDEVKSNVNGQCLDADSPYPYMFVKPCNGGRSQKWQF